MVARDPEQSSSPCRTGTRATSPASRDKSPTIPAWRTMRAVRRGRVYVATGNSLLQAYTDAGRIIRDVRTKFLRNG